MIKEITATGLVCLVGLATSGCSTPGLEDHQKKYGDMTVKELLESDNMSPENRQLLNDSINARAAVKALSGDYASAASHARMALKVSPTDTVAQLALAEALFGTGEFREAEYLFDKLSKENPSPQAHQGYGLTLLAQKKPGAAQSWLLKAVKEEPALWRAWNGLGVIYDMNESWEMAEVAFKAGIAVDGHNNTLDNNLGLSYMRQNRYREAIVSYENARKLQDNDTTTHMNYRTALALDGQLGKASAGATDTQVAQLYNNLGVAAIKSGDNKKAIEYLKKAISINPSYYANAVKNLEIAKSALP